jgi:chaperonin GroES
VVCRLSNYTLCDLNVREDQEYVHIVTQSSQLYPIKIMGKRFLIAHNSFIKAVLTHNSKTTKDMEITVGEFTPFADLVLVQPIGDTQLKGSSLIVPATATYEAPTYGVIISVGPGTDKVKMVVKKDTKVVYRKGVGEPIYLDGVDYLLLRQDDLLLGKLD